MSKRAFFIRNKLAKYSLLGLISTSCLANAEQDLFDMTLEQLLDIKVISVSKKNESLNEAPGIVSVITRDIFKQLGLRTINDALKLIPGYQVEFTPRKPIVYARGTAESALVLIDGVPVVSPLDNEIFLDGSISIDIIDRIEVIRGAGGVLWGATAYVGIINIVTRSPEKNADKLTVTTELASLGSNGLDSTRVNFNYQKQFENLSLLFNMSENQSKDYVLQGNNLRSPITGLWNDGYSNEDRRKTGFFRDYFLKLKYKDLTFTTRFADEQDWYQIDFRGRTTAEGFDFEENDPIKQLVFLDYDTSFEKFDLHSRISTMQRTGFLTLGSSFGSHPDGNVQFMFEEWNVRQNSFSAELTSDQLFKNNQTIFGFNYVNQSGSDIWARHIVKDFSGGVEGLAVDPVWFEENKWVTHRKLVDSGPGEKIYSLFVNSAQKISDKLTLSAGYRFDDNSAYDSVNHFSFNSVYQFIEDHYFKIIFNEGFRPADWEQKNSLSLGGGELQPEESRSLDFQYNTTLNNNTAIFVNYSQTITDNLIGFVTVDNTEGGSDIEYANNGRREIGSLEAGVKHLFDDDKGYLFANYSQNKVEDDELGRINHFADGITNIGTYWKFNSAISTSLTIHHEGKKLQTMHPEGYSGDEMLSSDQLELRQINSYSVVNWGISYVSNKFETSFFINNLFDKNYTSTSLINRAREELPNPPRNFVVSFAYQF